MEGSIRAGIFKKNVLINSLPKGGRSSEVFVNSRIFIQSKVARRKDQLINRNLIFVKRKGSSDPENVPRAETHSKKDRSRFINSLLRLPPKKKPRECYKSTFQVGCDF